MSLRELAAIPKASQKFLAAENQRLASRVRREVTSKLETGRKVRRKG